MSTIVANFDTDWKKADCERSKAAHQRLDPSDPYPAPKIFGPDCSTFDRLNAELQRLLTR